MPVINDPRVKFFKGWFDQTLTTYSVLPHDVLVVNLDADLLIPPPSLSCVGCDPTSNRAHSFTLMK